MTNLTSDDVKGIKRDVKAIKEGLDAITLEVDKACGREKTLGKRWSSDDYVEEKLDFIKRYLKDMQQRLIHI